MKHVKTIMASAIVSATIVSATAQADTLGNFVGGALGMRSAQEYADSVASHAAAAKSRRDNQKQVAEHEDWMAERRRKQQHAEAMLGASMTTAPEAGTIDGSTAPTPLNHGVTPGLRNIPTSSTAPATAPPATGQKAGVDTGFVPADPGRSTEPETQEEVVAYLENSPPAGRDTERLYGERQFYIDTINQQITRDSAKAAEYYRLAEIAHASGAFTSRDKYVGLADALIEQSRAAKIGAEVAVRDFDAKILLAQGADALRDLSLGSTSRASQVLTYYNRVDTLIIPRSDGKFDVEVGGQLQKTLTSAGLSDRLRKTLQSSIP